jgi:hypothetical protein
MIQATLLGATLLVFALDNLRNAAFFTFALSVCGPLSLFSSMSLVELLFSGNKRYCNIREIALAQIAAFCGLSLVAAILVILWNPSYLPVFLVVAVSRLADLISSLGMHVMRRNGWFLLNAALAMLQLSSFCLFVVLSRFVHIAPPYLQIAMSFALATTVQAIATWYFLRVEFNPGDVRSNPLGFLLAHSNRGLAIALNSLQSNAPRYGLECLVSPQYQAAYSLAYTFSRAGTIALQSLFVPVVGLFKESFNRSPRRAVIVACLFFFLGSFLFSAALIAIWYIAIKYDLVHLLGAETRSILTENAGVSVFAASGFYLLRFGVWQLVSLLDSGRLQLIFAVCGLLTTVVLGTLMIPSGHIAGAAICDVGGNLLLIALPVVLWMHQRSKANARS